MDISVDIPDDHISVKFGYTDDFHRRTGENMKTYEKQIKGAKLELLGYELIDPIYLSKAETAIKNFFGIIGTMIEYIDHKEIVAVSPDSKIEKEILAKFTDVADKYSNNVTNT